jgi:hypothetical protein
MINALAANNIGGETAEPGPIERVIRFPAGRTKSL